MGSLRRRAAPADEQGSEIQDWDDQRPHALGLQQDLLRSHSDCFACVSCLFNQEIFPGLGSPDVAENISLEVIDTSDDQRLYPDLSGLN